MTSAFRFHVNRKREREKLYAPLGSGISNFDGIIGRSVDVSTFEGRRRRLVRQLDSRTLTIRDGSMRDFHRESRGFVRRCAKLNRNSNRCSSRGHCVREDSSRSQPNEDKFPVEETILTKCFLRSMNEKLIAKPSFQQQLSWLSQLSWNICGNIWVRLFFTYFMYLLWWKGICTYKLSFPVTSWLDSSIKLSKESTAYFWNVVC